MEYVSPLPNTGRKVSTSVGDTLVTSWDTSFPSPEPYCSLSVSVPSVLLFPDSRTISKVVEDGFTSLQIDFL